MKKVILIIRDGWGYRKSEKENAIRQTKTPVDDKLRKNYPWTLLNASGKAVGLPQGYQGNSEVGHLTMGSGRIIDQSLVRINQAIKDKSFFQKKELIHTINHCKKNNSRFHLIGLLQKQGVHSHLDHLLATLKTCEKNNFSNVCLHIITDGRDAPVKQGINYLKELIEKKKLGELVTISGRYYAMDRDKRWDRTKKAYQAMVNAKSDYIFQDPVKRLKESYASKKTDEFIIPSVKENYLGVNSQDAVFFYNFRTDRLRQLAQTMIAKKRKVLFLAMTSYYKNIRADVLFPEEKTENILGEILSKNKIRQLRISETEKYPHVTFFFNGQKEQAFPYEDRIMVPSPKIDTYDLKPEMSIEKVTSKLNKEIKKDKYGFILVNLVNADMVGHTGKKAAIKKAVQAVDQSVGKIVDEGKKNDYTILITGDHGNAEDQTKKWGTSHTINPVPLIFLDKKCKLKNKQGLKDIAPTVLKLMKIKKPKQMKGESLFLKFAPWEKKC